MASLRLRLGLVPSTAKIERRENALKEEYDKLLRFGDSEKLARYSELDSVVNGSGFRQKRREIESLSYKGSPEHQKEQEYRKLEKSKDIRLYLKTVGGNDIKWFKEAEESGLAKRFEELEQIVKSASFRDKQKMKPVTFKDSDEYRQYTEYKRLMGDKELKIYNKFAGSSDYRKLKKIEETGKPARYEELRSDPQSDEYKKLRKDKDIVTWLRITGSPEYRNYQKVKGSEKLQRFRELSDLVESPEFKAKQKMKPVRFKDTDEYLMLEEYKSLKSSPEIKRYYKFRKSKEYDNYMKTEGSARLAKFHELRAEVQSETFIERKSYLLDKKRFLKSDMYEQQKEYDELKRDPDIVWYYKVKDSDRFDALKGRELTFSEEFDNGDIDPERWLTTYYWGEKLLNDRYAVDGDLHIHTPQENFDIRNSVLTIVTKHGKCEGKVWGPLTGFRTRQFEYTSGQINSGKSFRQKYGIFEAKIRLGNATARNGFWLLGDTRTPHIDICRTGDGKIWFDLFRSEKELAKKGAPSKYANDFYIFSLEWTPDKMVWKINGLEVFSQTGNLPDEPMYITLAGGVDSSKPATSNMEIDWIRVYKS